MKKLILLIAIYLPFNLFGQISTTPSFPIETDKVTITFDATKGNAALKDYTGDVYAHTGLITNKSASLTDWKYVKTKWGENTAETKLTRISSNIYELTISPDIRSYYGVAANEKILKMAFVFRSADASKQGKDSDGHDIFSNIYESGLNVNILNPSSNFLFVQENQSINISIAATGNDSIGLFLDNKWIISTSNQTLNCNIIATGTEMHTIVAKAYKGFVEVSDTVNYLIPSDVENTPLPNNVRDGINYIDNKTVTLVLFAPFKKYVYVVGDFNNWIPNTLYMMKKDGDHFWITLTDLTPEKEYIFQYLIDGTLRIADPYTEKTSDPNDKYISENIYPNLIKYPESKTSEIASIIKTGQTPYLWEVNNFVPSANEKLVIYELLIRDFTANGDIKTVTDTLSYLKRLGINAIELMPISEFEGNDSWGYNPSFYFAPDKAYGTKNDYKRFIDECHKNGIAVIQDLVLNHSYSQSPLVRMYFDGSAPTAQNPWYNRTSPNTVYSWGNDFNHESAYTKKLIDSVAAFWISEYKIDGFRFDFTKGFTNTSGDGWAYDPSRIGILKRFATEIWKRKPNAYVIFEHLAANNEETTLANFGIMLWGNMNPKYNEATMGYNTDGKSDLSWISYENRGWNNANVVGYMESHDEERLMVKNLAYGNSAGTYNITDTATSLNRVAMASAFFYTIPGPKMLWQFGELGYNTSIDEGGRVGKKPIRWDYYNDSNRRYLYEITSALIRLKKEEPAFSTSNYTLKVSGVVKQIELLHATANVEIVGNFDVVSKDYTITFPSIGWWYDYLAADSISVNASSTTIALKPGEYHIYTSKKLTNFGNIPKPLKPLSTLKELIIYPNPTADKLYMQSEFKIESLQIFDIQGKLVLKNELNAYSYISLGKLSKGMYIVKALFANQKATYAKVLKM